MLLYFISASDNCKLLLVFHYKIILVIFFTADDATDVGEEDSFLGQTTSNPNPPPTFSYFSQVPSSSDPFGSIGQPSLGASTPTQVGVPAFSTPPVSLPLLPGSQGGSNAFSGPVSKAQSFNTPPPPTSRQGLGSYQTGLPPPAFSTPPQGTSQQGYNPYRHTTLSSRANPYITPPQLQQTQSHSENIHPPPSVPPMNMYPSPPGVPLPV